MAGKDADLAMVKGEEVGDGGVKEGRLLVSFAEAVLGDDDHLLDKRRQELLERLGAEALVDAAGVVAGFNAVVRIANATGIPLDDFMEAQSGDIRSALGIDELPATKGA